MKTSQPINLAVRPPSSNHQPIPSFHRQNRVVNSQTLSQAGTIDLFAPNAACTIQWVLVYVSAAATVQLVLNGTPYGAALAVNAGAVIRFAGTLLVNNEKLSLSVSVAATINYEVVWIKEFFPDIIVRDTSINNGASSGMIISGVVSVSNFPATQPISGAVSVSNLPVTQPVSGSVSVSNLPENNFPQVVNSGDGFTVASSSTQNGNLQTTPVGARQVVINATFGAINGSPTCQFLVYGTDNAGVSYWNFAYFSIAALGASANSNIGVAWGSPAQGSINAGVAGTFAPTPLIKNWRIQYRIAGTFTSCTLASTYLHYN